LRTGNWELNGDKYLYKRRTARLYFLAGIFCVWLLRSACGWSTCKFSVTGILRRRAQHQQQRSFDLSAKRGVIYDRAGRELRCRSRWTRLLWCLRKRRIWQYDQPDYAHSTKDDPRVVLADCSAHKFCWVARRADAEAIERIRALICRAFHYQKEPSGFIRSGSWRRKFWDTWGPTIRTERAGT